MKPIFQKISLLIIVFSLSLPHTFAHDHHMSSSKIYQDENGKWKLKINMATGALVQALRHELKDTSIRASYGDDFKLQVKNYLIAQVKIEINKYAKATLSNFNPIYDGHAFEATFDLQGVPVRPDYWSIKATLCEYDAIQKHRVIIIMNKVLSSFLMEKKKTPSMKLIIIKGTDGKFKKVT